MEKVPTSNPSREASVHNYYKHTQNLNHNYYKHTQNLNHNVFAKWKAIYGTRRIAKLKTQEAGMLRLDAPFGHRCARIEPTTGANVSP